jgi:hypothetical protein
MPNNANSRMQGGNSMILVSYGSNLTIAATLTAGSTCLDCGHLQESDPHIKGSKTTRENEAGQVIGVLFKTEGGTTAVLEETDKTKQDYLAFVVRNTNQLEIKYAGIVNGKKQEVFKMTWVTPNSSASDKGTMPYESTALVPAVAIVISAQNITDIKTALTTTTIYATGPVTIAAGKEHEIVET